MSIAEQMELMKNTPPCPLVIGNPTVPSDGLYRMYDTTGRLILYVNRATVERLFRRHGREAMMQGYYGIPVVVE